MEGGKGSSRRERDTQHMGVYRLEKLGKLLFLLVPFIHFHLQNIIHSLLVPLLFGFSNWPESRCSVCYQYNGTLLPQSRVLGAEGVSVSSCQLYLTQRAGILPALFCLNLNALFSPRGM